jgi:hypothetical protein
MNALLAASTRAKTDKLSLTGQIAYNLKTEPDKDVNYYLSQILELIKSYGEFKRRKMGSYIFRGGVISHTQTINAKDGYVTVTLRFQKAKPAFLDNLVEAATRIAEKCSLSCSLKADVDFGGLKSYLRGNAEWFGEAEETFSSKISMKGREIHLTAYPSMRMLNLTGEFHRKRGIFQLKGKPSLILDEILKKGGVKT